MYKALGIGLGFNFDHMKELEDREKPSLRRLQARAAKSAVLRVQELYDQAKALRLELEAIDDPSIREQRQFQHQNQTLHEIQRLADRLSNLIPNDMSLGLPPEAKIEQFVLHNDAVGHSTSLPHLLVLPRSGSLAVQRLMEFYESRGEGSGNNSVPNSSGSDEVLDDAEFLDAWAKRRLYETRPPGLHEDGDGGDGPKMVLV